MCRKNAAILQKIGMLLIVTVLLTDRYLFPVKDGFILVSAVISSIILIYAIYMLKKHEIDETIF